jgi:predicted phage terminase large subunit-like protein
MLTIGAELPSGTVWSPHPGPQTTFLQSACYEALYGGAAGGGKSDALLAGALWGVHLPGYTAILFRRTFPELEKNLIPRSHELIRRAFRGAKYNDQRKVWSFPSGARLHFGHLESEEDVYQHQSAQYQYIGFDELTTFTERQYTLLLSRARSPQGIPIYIRSATNPGGGGHDWVFRRWGPWLNPMSQVRALPGRSLRYLPEPDGGVRWVPPSTPRALSRVFVPARLSDNPTLSGNDPQYVTRLSGLDPVTRARLRDGDWLVKPAAGLLFKRAWFDIVAVPPSSAESTVRRWDLAATEAKDGRDPDWTVGARWSRTKDGTFYVEDMVRLQGRPLQVEHAILDAAMRDGKDVKIVIPQDPGAAGVFAADNLTRKLHGYDVHTARETGDKKTRVRPVSAQAEQRHIKLVRGEWNEAWLQEHEAFPDGVHDDQVDTSSGAFAALEPESDEVTLRRRLDAYRNWTP